MAENVFDAYGSKDEPIAEIVEQAKCEHLQVGSKMVRVEADPERDVKAHYHFGMQCHHCEEILGYFANWCPYCKIPLP